MTTDAGKELKLWQERPALWAALLLLKHTKKTGEFKSTREALMAELTEDDRELLREAWRECRGWL